MVLQGNSQWPRSSGYEGGFSFQREGDWHLHWTRRKEEAVCRGVALRVADLEARGNSHLSRLVKGQDRTLLSIEGVWTWILITHQFSQQHGLILVSHFIDTNREAHRCWGLIWVTQVLLPNASDAPAIRGLFFGPGAVLSAMVIWSQPYQPFWVVVTPLWQKVTWDLFLWSDVPEEHSTGSL